MLTRGDDLLVLGVRMTGVSFGADGATAVAEGNAQVVFIFPPQHLAEEVVSDAPAGGWLARSQLAGPSRVAFDVAAGTKISLTASGILTACRQLSLPRVPPTAFDTAIEIPWHLAFAVISADPATRLAALHSGDAVTSPTGVVGLWLSRLGVRAGVGGVVPAPGEAGGPFELVPVDSDLANTADPGFAHSLDVSDRNKIVALSGTETAASAAHPVVQELAVTSLGGSLVVNGQWDGFGWRHHASVGRDQQVIVEQVGFCYPFGLRVLFTATVQRRVETPGSGDEAALRVDTTLRFLEQRASAPAGKLFSRAFPFASVEVTQQIFDNVSLDYFYSYKRPTPDTTQLKANLAALQDQADTDKLSWAPLVSATWTYEHLAASGDPDAMAYINAVVALGDPDNGLYKQKSDLEAAKAQRDADEDAEDRDQAIVNQLEQQGASEDEIAQAEAQVQLDVAAVSQDFFSQAQLDDVNAQIAVAEATVIAETNALSGIVNTPQPEQDQALEAANSGSAEASDWLTLQPQIKALTDEIAAEELMLPPFPIAAWPRQTSTAGAGDRPLIQFPVRLRTRTEDIRFELPLIFVADLDLPATNTAPEYRSLDDPELPAQLDDAWLAQRAGVIGLQGQVLDLVGSAEPQPQDAHEIHAINILGGTGAFRDDRSGDLFAATLGRATTADPNLKWGMQIVLPALRALGSETPAIPAIATTTADGFPGSSTSPGIPGLDVPPVLVVPPGLPLLPGVPVHFDDEYLSIGEQSTALLKPITDIAVNFTSHADRSGGLAAIALTADGISRSLGPVQVAGLTSPDPSKLIGDAATLLGFKLQDLLKLPPNVPPPPVPQPPPAIVNDILHGKQPVIRMEWTDVAVHDFLALRAYPTTAEPDRRTLLWLSVVSSIDEVSTTCSVTDFDLVFPPSGGDFLRLTIASLMFSQHTTPQHADPPHLDVGPIDMTFSGPLTFVQALQDAVQLVGKGATVKTAPTGIVASFTLPVPPVECGVFNLSNITFQAGVTVPFGGDPVLVSVAFASRSNPFNLSVMALGGGGYLVVNIAKDGPSIEASLEFGAMMAVSFVIASAEVHVLGGVRYIQPGDDISLTGYVRIGGAVAILGLITVSIELVVELTYDITNNILHGHATLVIELDLTLWSDKVELDSGEWTFVGGAHAALDELAAAESDDAGFATWRRYRAAFGVTT